MNISVECWVKKSTYDEKENKLYNIQKPNWNLRYLTFIHLDILFGLGLVSSFIEISIITHLKSLKRILWYIKGTVDFSLFYSYSNNFDLISYSDNDCVVDINDRKSIISCLLNWRHNIYMEF